MPYDFAYTIKDEPTYNDFGRQESSDGKVVKGSYRVALPDGRTQIVTYTADEYGYRADVKYEGEVKQVEYKTKSYPVPVAYPKDVYSEPLYRKIELTHYEPTYLTTESVDSELVYSTTESE